MPFWHFHSINLLNPYVQGGLVVAWIFLVINFLIQNQKEVVVVLLASF